MKKLIVLFAVIAMGVNAMAQETTKKPTTTKQNPLVGKTMDDTGVVMKAGKVWMYKDGVSTFIEQDIKLNATVVKPDGTVILKDGKTVVMKEGDRVTAEGDLIMSVQNETPENKMEYEKQ